VAAARACQAAGIGRRRGQVSLMDLRDRVPVTELATMADLQLALEGAAILGLLDGFCDAAAGQVRGRVDSGLECFGRPIGASGPSMVCEMDPQRQGRAGQRQPEAPSGGTPRVLGGFPSRKILATSANRRVRRVNGRR
jgi:acetyl-CoA C-acetyltransferase